MRRLPRYSKYARMPGIARNTNSPTAIARRAMTKRMVPVINYLARHARSGPGRVRALQHRAQSSRADALLDWRDALPAQSDRLRVPALLSRCILAPNQLPLRFQVQSALHPVALRPATARLQL